MGFEVFLESVSHSCSIGTQGALQHLAGVYAQVVLQFLFLGECYPAELAG